MPKLQNPKHERFACEVAKGTAASRAYTLVYGPGKTPRTSASRLLATKANVVARITELQQKVEQKTVLTLQEKRDFLASIVRTPVGQIDENSPLAQSAEYDLTTDKNGKTTRRTLKIRMTDKLRALELDAKLAGELREDVNVKHTGQINHEHKAIIVNVPAAISQPRPLPKQLPQIDAHSDQPPAP